MRSATLLLALTLAATGVGAQEPPQPAPDAAAQPASAPWTFSATGYWNMPRESGDYLSGIFIAEKSQLHLEARANYEAKHSQSAFLGWSFSGGETVQFKATPIVGFLWGSTHGVIGGLEASVAFKNSTTTSKPNTWIRMEQNQDTSMPGVNLATAPSNG
ncbi:hypothetical protein [Cupriavidus basilensis]